MFKKITISTNTSHKQCVGYKEKMSYQTRLHNANATNLRENGKILDLKNGYSKITDKYEDDIYDYDEDNRTHEKHYE